MTTNIQARKALLRQEIQNAILKLTKTEKDVQTEKVQSMVSYLTI